VNTCFLVSGVRSPAGLALKCAAAPHNGLFNITSEHEQFGNLRIAILLSHFYE